MMQVYDRVLASRSIPTLMVLSLLVSALYAFYAFLEALRSRMAGRYANALDSSLTSRLFEASVRLRLMPGAAVSADPVRDGDTVKQFLASSGPLTILDLLWLPIYLAVVFLLHPVLGWLATIGAAVTIVLMLLNELTSGKPAQAVNATQAARQRQSDDARLSAESIVANRERYWLACQRPNR